MFTRVASRGTNVSVIAEIGIEGVIAWEAMDGALNTTEMFRFLGKFHG